MDYIKTVVCPICGRMNKVPDNLEALVKTFIIRGEQDHQNMTLLSSILDELTQAVRSSVQTFLDKRKQGDPNNWIDIECTNKKSPNGRHGFRYNLVTSEVLK